MDALEKAQRAIAAYFKTRGVSVIVAGSFSIARMPGDRANNFEMRMKFTGTVPASINTLGESWRETAKEDVKAARSKKEPRRISKSKTE